MEPVLQFVRLLESETTDAQLLERYTQGDQQAFAYLVERHGRLVLGVCRRILSNPHDAEDAFQAVFLLLARKAGSLRQPGRLSAWLHGVACRVARKARSLRQRQRQRDAARPTPEATDPPDEHPLGELLTLLDEQLHRLPARYRVPLILHHLEGLTQAETARELNCPPGTVAARLSRGRELLRRLLERRGATLSATTVATLLTQAQTATANIVLATLVHGTAALGAAGATSAAVQALVKGVTTTMVLERIRNVALGLVLGLVCLTGTGWAVYYQPVTKPAPAPAFPVQPAPALAPVGEPTSATARTKNFRVVAENQRTAELIARAAEKERAALAVRWLGKELPDWPEPCAVRVRSGMDNHHHSTFTFDGDKLVRREMDLGGLLEHVLAVQLPHETTHALLADHFGRDLPRWASEGMAALAEDEVGQREYRQQLYRVVARAGRLPLAPHKFLTSTVYPQHDPKEFYALSHGLCEFLLARKDRPTLLAFVGDLRGTGKADVARTVARHYGLKDLQELEDAWLATLKKSMPEAEADAARYEKLFPTVAPTPALVSLSADRKFLSLRRPGFYYEPVTSYRPQAGGGYAATTSYVQRMSLTSQMLPLDGVVLRTAGGKTLSDEQVRARLKEECLVLWNTGPTQLPEGYLKLLNEETLILSTTAPVPPAEVPPPVAPVEPPSSY